MGGARQGRQLWLNVHRFIALVAGAVIAALGASGAALVMKGPLARFDFGASTFDLPASRPAQWAPVDAWADAARAAHPQIRAVVSVTAPGASPLPTEAALVTAMLHDGGFGFVTVDPVSARPLGFFRYGDGWLFAVLDFHRHLLLPDAVEEIGETVTTWCGVLLVVSLGSGLYLWWPRGGGLRARLAIRRGPGFWGSLHVALSTWVAIPLALVGASGVLLARPAWLPGVPAPVALQDPAQGACRPVAGLADAVGTALRATDYDRFSKVTVLPDGSAWLVRVPGTAGNLRVDRTCATVTVLGPPPSQRNETVQSLHASLLMGEGGQALVFVAGVSLPCLYVTGLWAWWRRRARRRDQL